MTIPVAWIEEVIEQADGVLRVREHEIENGMLDGIVWQAACYTGALAVVRRTRSARRRRS